MVEKNVKLGTDYCVSIVFRLEFELQMNIYILHWFYIDNPLWINDPLYPTQIDELKRSLENRKW